MKVLIAALALLLFGCDDGGQYCVDEPPAGYCWMWDNGSSCNGVCCDDDCMCSQVDWPEFFEGFVDTTTPRYGCILGVVTVQGKDVMTCYGDCECEILDPDYIQTIR